MKTTNNLQKTENNKFRVNVSKTFAVVASLVLVSLTVSANGFWKQVFVNNSFGKMAIMMVDQGAEANVVPAASVSHADFYSDLTASSAKLADVVAQEKALEVESWMTNNNNFSTNRFNDFVAHENPLELENWMTDSRSFSAPEGDQALRLEAWMTNTSAWK